MKDWFFLTDREYFVTYLCVAKNIQRASGAQSLAHAYEKYAYVPNIFETMSAHKVKQYQKRLSLKFMWWSLFNGSAFRNATDASIVKSSSADLVCGVFLVWFSSIVLYRFLRRLQSPFFEIMLEDRFITLPRAKKVVAGAIGASSTYVAIDNIISQQHLFDLALEYKEFLRPGELVSSNCEDLVREKMRIGDEQTKLQNAAGK